MAEPCLKAGPAIAATDKTYVGSWIYAFKGKKEKGAPMGRQIQNILSANKHLFFKRETAETFFEASNLAAFNARTLTTSPSWV